MKRILSIVITIFIITNLFGTVMTASAVENEFSQKQYNITNTETYDINTGSETDTYIDINEGVSLYPILEKRNYMETEQISVRFVLTMSLIGIESSFEAVGFTVLNDVLIVFDEASGCQIINVVLKHDGYTVAPYFSLNVVTITGSEVSAELFGCVSDNGLFISDSSYDAAKEASYYYLVETDLITMAEFNELLRLEYSQKGVEYSDNIIDNNMVSEASLGEGENASTNANVAGETTVFGTLGWNDDNNVWHPMQYNKVEVWDDRSGEKLGTVYTNTTGNYSFAFLDSSTYRNIYIKVYPGGENSIVKTGYGGDYVYTSQTRLNVTPGSGVSIGWEIDMTSDLGRAFQISQAINVATKYVKQMNGSYIAPLTVKYPHVESSNSCFYRSSNDTIYVLGSSSSTSGLKSYASWDVVMHEYGHHVQAEFGITRNPGGSHTLKDNLADMNNSKDIGVRLAWGEAYASVFGGMAQAYYASSLQNISTVGDSAYSSYNGASLDYETPNVRLGEACEGSVIGVLWDIYDTASETYDDISFSHSAYWDMITNCNSENLSEFCNYFVNKYSIEYAFSLGKLLSYYKMAATDLSANVSSTSISLFWTANGTTTSLPNDRFDLLFFDEDNSEILSVNNITSTSYTLSDAERNTVLRNGDATFKVIVVSYQTSSPTTGGYYSEVLSISKPHNPHSYGPYLYYNNYSHISYCSCGTYVTEGHYIRQEDIVDNRYAKCLGCHVQLDLFEDSANIIMSTITQVSVNGSYILPSGIVVLVDEDIQAYLDGTLVFYHPDNIPATQ